ncbi:MAG TPA: hypothetical protein VNB94_11240 [Mycobacteriales bacterium]|nr:hypothetical protein [Mycobacteriales bacterium]
MARYATRIDLRQAALAISVLIDLDLDPHADGVLVSGVPPVLVGWRECRTALRGASPDTAQGRTLLARWLLRRRWIADHTFDDLAERSRPVGLPPRHALHPGADWVCKSIIGSSLDLGLGFRGVQPGHPDRVIIVPHGVLTASGTDMGAFWKRATAYLEQMGELAVARWRRDRGAVVRPMGDCDVVTLLGSRTFRWAVTAEDPHGMRAAVVPMRTRGWLDVSRIDPAFGPAAARATDAVDRGFARPVLITVDEVSVVAPGGRPQAALDDPAPARNWLRPLLYR